jgi:hypothetical protein
MGTLLRNADGLGAVTSINHPAIHSGEMCMGCGWTLASSLDMHLMTALEAVNGGSEQYGISDIPFWNKALDSGYRLTGIGGSHNHRPMQPLEQIGSVGSPTTVVYAAELSTPAILAGVRAGHVFIDLAGTRDRLLEVTARAGDQVAHMGDLLNAGANVSTADQTFPWSWVSDGRRHWFRAEVLSPNGKPWLLGNPLYINWNISN